jgi:hypothetical protein
VVGDRGIHSRKKQQIVMMTSLGVGARQDSQRCGLCEFWRDDLRPTHVFFQSTTDSVMVDGGIAYTATLGQSIDRDVTWGGEIRGRRGPNERSDSAADVAGYCLLFLFSVSISDCCYFSLLRCDCAR